MMVRSVVFPSMVKWVYGARWVTVMILVMAAVVMGFESCARAEEMLRTNSEHQRPVPRLGGMAINRDSYPPKVALPAQIVILDRKKEWRNSGKVDQKLSQACAEGMFDEIVPKYYRAIFKDGVLGVAFGHGLNLRDEKKLADPKKVYLFVSGDTTGCTVLVLPNKDPRVESFKSPAKDGKTASQSQKPAAR
ncbi:Secreted protein [Azospirillaceae bacterium]